MEAGHAMEQDHLEKDHVVMEEGNATEHDLDQEDLEEMLEQNMRTQI